MFGPEGGGSASGKERWSLTSSERSAPGGDPASETRVTFAPPRGVSARSDLG
jgi:hypothetical protein